MDRKTRKELQKEVKSEENRQGKLLEEAAADVSDSRILEKARKQRQGGTAEAEDRIRGLFQQGNEKVRAKFASDLQEASKQTEEIEKHAEEDRANRDRGYQDTRQLDGAVRNIQNTEVSKELQGQREASAKEAVFFQDQKRNREKMAKQGRRIENDLQKQMGKVDTPKRMGESSESMRNPKVPSENQAFVNIFGKAEQSPVGGKTGEKKKPNSHLGYVQPLNPDSKDPGWHITTEIHGLEQGEKISEHDHVDDLED